MRARFSACITVQLAALLPDSGRCRLHEVEVLACSSTLCASCGLLALFAGLFYSDGYYTTILVAMTMTIDLQFVATALVMHCVLATACTGSFRALVFHYHRLSVLH